MTNKYMKSEICIDNIDPLRMERDDILYIITHNTTNRVFEIIT